MIWIILELKQDNLVLTIITKVCKVPFEITGVGESTLQIMAKFNEQRVITPEGILQYILCENLRKTLWYLTL